MTVVYNASLSNELYVGLYNQPPPVSPPFANSYTIAPKGANVYGPSPPTLPLIWLMFFPEKSQDSIPFWRGSVGVHDNLAVDPVTKVVSISHAGLQQDRLDAFKKLFPNLPDIQGLALEEVIRRTVGKWRDGSTASVGNMLPPAPTGDATKREATSPCTYAKVIVVVDALFLAMGAYGLARVFKYAHPSWIEHIAEQLAPHMTEIDKIAMRLANPSNSPLTKAQEVFKIGKLIYTVGLFEAIFKAAMSTLSWWDMVLYGTLGITELTIAFASEGGAVIPIIVADIALAAFFVTDLERMAEACGWTF